MSKSPTGGLAGAQLTPAFICLHLRGVSEGPETNRRKWYYMGRLGGDIRLRWFFGKRIGERLRMIFWRGARSAQQGRAGIDLVALALRFGLAC
jgi:hypothetical protein